MMVTRSEAAKLIRVSLSKFEKLEAKNGAVPSIKKGKSRQIDVGDLIAWEVGRRIYEEAGESEFDLTDQKARLAYHQANRTELQTKKMRGELVDAEDFRDKYLNMIVGFQKNLLNMPARLSYDLSNMTKEVDIREKMLAEIKEALDELSNG